MNVVRSEWIKLRSTRGNVINLALVVVLLVGFGSLISFAVRSQWHTMTVAEKLSFDPLHIALAGSLFAQFAAGVLGARCSAGEFSSGMMRLSLLATPQRGRLFGAKAVVVSLSVLVAGVVGSLVAFYLGMTILRGVAPTYGFSQPGVWRALVGEGVVLWFASLTGMALGFLLRQVSSAISLFVGLYLIVPILTLFLPATWRDHIAQYLPSNLGRAVDSLVTTPGDFSPSRAVLTLALYAVAWLAAAGLTFQRRDA